MIFASCLFLLSCGIHANASDRNTFYSSYVAHDVELETDPQSPFWQHALSVYAEVDNHGRPISKYRTRISSRWTKNNLYLLFECPYKELYLKSSPNVMEETYGLWNWDVAELFIGSDFHNIRQYKEFEVSPQREWVDLDINLDLPDHTEGWKWNSGFQVAARIDPKAKIWYGAMRIPFASLDQRRPAAGNTFRANLFRSQGPPDHRTSITWRAPMSDTFHVPENFGLLKLVKDK
jgi:Carbohydrate family 9 binding domain-like